VVQASRRRRRYRKNKHLIKSKFFFLTFSVAFAKSLYPLAPFRPSFYVVLPTILLSLKSHTCARCARKHIHYVPRIFVCREVAVKFMSFVQIFWKISLPIMPGACYEISPCPTSVRFRTRSKTSVLHVCIYITWFIWLSTRLFSYSLNSTLSLRIECVWLRHVPRLHGYTVNSNYWFDITYICF